MKDITGFAVSAHIEDFSTRTLKELSLNTSSKGNQRKWYEPIRKLWIKGPFEYQGVIWKDWMVELAACEIARQLGIDSVLKQVPCTVDQSINCVYSEDFSEQWEFISFHRILKREGIDFPANAFIDHQFNFIIEVIDEVCSINVENYLKKMILLDSLEGNEDRHLNNFGVFKSGDMYHEALLFDFGLGLFEHDRRYAGLSLEQAIDEMRSKPFHANPMVNLRWLKRNNFTYTGAISGIEMPGELAAEYVRSACEEAGIACFL